MDRKEEKIYSDESNKQKDRSKKYFLYAGNNGFRIEHLSDEEAEENCQSEENYHAISLSEMLHLSIVIHNIMKMYNKGGYNE